MDPYSKANYQTLVDILVETYGFTVDYIHGDVICEFIYANEMPMFRLIYIEEKGMIAVSFNVCISKTDAFDILHFIREQMPKVKISSEYIVDDNGQTLFDHEAYMEMERQIESRSVPVMREEFTYEPDFPIIHTSQDSIFHAQDPRAQEQKKLLEQKMRYYGKFTWEDLDD